MAHRIEGKKPNNDDSRPFALGLSGKNYSSVVSVNSVRDIFLALARSPGCLRPQRPQREGIRIRGLALRSGLEN